MPANRRPYLGNGFVAMAHRGGWLRPEDRARENTWYAFKQAIAEGYRYLETDVHTTSDHKLVAFHDPDLGRVAGISGQIANQPWSDLAKIRIGGSDPIPLLEDLLTELSDTFFNIDLKDEGSVSALPPLLKRLGADERVCVASFSTSRLSRFRALAPQVLTATTPREVAWHGFAFGLRRWPLGVGEVLQVPTRALGGMVPLVRRDVIDAAHRAGRAVHVWTVDQEAEMERLIDLGVDGIVTNEIGILKKVLIRRGEWEGQ